MQDGHSVGTVAPSAPQSDQLPVILTALHHLRGGSRRRSRTSCWRCRTRCCGGAGWCWPRWPGGARDAVGDRRPPRWGEAHPTPPGDRAAEPERLSRHREGSFAAPPGRLPEDLRKRLPQVGAIVFPEAAQAPEHLIPQDGGDHRLDE
jgi:hypothetical protein